MNPEDLLGDIIDTVEDELASRRGALPVRQRGEWRQRLVYCVKSVAQDTATVYLNRKYEVLAVGGRSVDLSDRRIFRRINEHSAPGYLFNDSTAPWYGRRDAAEYLRCLRVLRHVATKPATAGAA